MPKHVRVVVSILLCFVSFTAAHATCTANVSASVSGTTLSMDASGGGTCGASSISSVFLDNTLIGNQSCAGSTCSFSQTRSTTCLRSGTHTVSAGVTCGKIVGNSCPADTDGVASATFMVNSQPTVSLSYAPGADGLGNVIINYSFPNTVAPAERTLSRSFAGPGFISVDTIHPETAEGTWVIAWGVGCYPAGSYVFQATATHCSGDEPLPPIAGTTLSRTYDSHHQMAGLFGRGWMTILDRRLVVIARPDGDVVYFTTETNDVVVFALANGAYVQRWPRNTNGTGALIKDTANGVYIHRAAGAATPIWQLGELLQKRRRQPNVPAIA